METILRMETREVNGSGVVRVGILFWTRSACVRSDPPSLHMYSPVTFLGFEGRGSWKTLPLRVFPVVARVRLSKITVYYDDFHGHE